MKKITTIRGLLKKAAAIIKEKGLAKNIQMDGTGRVCVYGALLAADGLVPMDSGPSPLVVKAAERLERSLGLTPDRGYAAANWNNQDERTKKQVVAALLKAAA